MGSWWRLFIYEKVIRWKIPSLISVDVDKELITTSNAWCLQSNRDVSEANTTRNYAGISTSSISIQVQSSNATDVTNTSVNDVFAVDSSGITSSIDCVS